MKDSQRDWLCSRLYLICRSRQVRAAQRQQWLAGTPPPGCPALLRGAGAPTKRPAPRNNSVCCPLRRQATQIFVICVLLAPVCQLQHGQQGGLAGRRLAAALEVRRHAGHLTHAIREGAAQLSQRRCQRLAAGRRCILHAPLALLALAGLLPHERHHPLHAAVLALRRRQQVHQAIDVCRAQSTPALVHTRQAPQVAVSQHKGGLGVGDGGAQAAQAAALRVDVLRHRLGNVLQVARGQRGCRREGRELREAA